MNWSVVSLLSRPQEICMARISGAPRNQGGLLRRLFVGIVYSLTQRTARPGHHACPGDGSSSQSLLGISADGAVADGLKLVDEKLKGLAQLRVATLVGCPF